MCNVQVIFKTPHLLSLTLSPSKNFKPPKKNGSFDGSLCHGSRWKWMSEWVKNVVVTQHLTRSRKENKLSSISWWHAPEFVIYWPVLTHWVLHDIQQPSTNHQFCLRSNFHSAHVGLRFLSWQLTNSSFSQGQFHSRFKLYAVISLLRNPLFLVKIK